ncbi:nucleotidyltransferase [Brucella sp. 21LCYQ03]|nr:nucleotidyltransferase [Brucella sp. 21LCYQ03]
MKKTSIAIQPHQLRWIERNLTAIDIPFVVIGGFAVQYYYSARETEDVDLFIGADPSVIERLVLGIRELARDPCAKVKLLDQSVGHFKVGGEHKIDVLSFAPALNFDEAYRTAEPFELEGVALPILSRALLIDHKKAVGDKKDLEDIRRLEKA